MSWKKWIALLCAAGMITILSACKDKEPEPEPEPTKEVVTQEAPEEEEEEEAEVTAGVSAEEAYKLYAGVLEANKDAILAYDWQKEISADYEVMDPARPVAFCDLNNDGIPELFYMTADSQYEAFLHITTIVNGSVRDMIYPFDENETGKLSDAAAGGGNEYLLYTGKDGNLYMYYVSSNETSIYAIYAVQMKNGQLMRVSKGLNVMSPVYDDDGMMQDEMENIYYVNDSEVSSSEGTAAFEEAFDQMDQVILYSGYDSGAVWKNVKNAEALCTTYEDALKTAEGEK